MSAHDDADIDAGQCPEIKIDGTEATCHELARGNEARGVVVLLDSGGGRCSVASEACSVSDSVSPRTHANWPMWGRRPRHFMVTIFLVFLGFFAGYRERRPTSVNASTVEARMIA
jgi:hypothetical protein